ncbi:MAG: C-GCAxxG-C-C family protein [Candidatus Thorarchaeota archaeon]
MAKSTGHSFNCVEDVMMRVNRENQLHGFNESCMKIGSVFGGGIAGSGEVCGAASGGVMCLALMKGTTGDEPIDIFKKKRTEARKVISTFLSDFATAWGTVQCRFLLAMDKGGIPTKGELRKGPPRNLCNEYVDWVVDEILRIASEISDTLE